LARTQDGDFALSPTELDALFDTAPGLPPGWEKLEDTTVTNDEGWVTLQGFLAQWSMSTALDCRTTQAYLAYLGMGEETAHALTNTRRRKEERKLNRNQRTVLLCYVVGAVGCGKTSILRRHIRRPIDEEHVHTTNPYSVVNTVEVDGIEKYLVVR